MVYLGAYSQGTGIVSLDGVNWPVQKTYHSPVASDKTSNSHLPAPLTAPPGRVEKYINHRFVRE